MPKQTRRGGRYTTRVNRDGSQQYARRPICGVIVIYGPAAAGLLVLVEATRGIWS